jgi:hypothetical protein
MYANVLRAGTLNDPRVVRLVVANFVPTHFNNNDPTRDKDDPGHQLWKSIKAQKELQVQGVWVVAPDGRVLGGMSAEVDGQPSDRVGNGPGAPFRPNPRFADAVLVLLGRTLREFGPVAPRDVKPQPLAFRGAGVRPDGGVRLVVYSRADNGLVFSVPLTQGEWSAFTPPQLAAGQRWSLPEAVARQFAPVLSPYADTRFRPRPAEATRAELHAVVEAVDAAQAQIRLSGRWEVDWVHDGTEHSTGAATAEGLLVYDIGPARPVKLLLVFDGTYAYTTGSGPARRQASAAVVRWRLDGPAE